MGYVTRNLIPGERVVHLGKVHWSIFVPGIVLFLTAILLIAGLGVGARNLGGSVAGLFLGVIALLLAMVSLARAFLYRTSTELAITTKRVIAKVGFISRKTVELNHSKVESFNIDQSILGRILDFGTVTVCGTGGGRTPIPNIDRPLEFRRQAMSVVDHASARA